MRNKEKPFAEVIAGKSTEVLLELRGQYQEEFRRFPKAKSLDDAIKQIDAEIRRRPDAPKLVKVRAKEWVTVDGKEFASDQAGEITEQQYAALARFFEKLES